MKTKTKPVRCKCGATTTPRKYQSEGWLKVRIDYTDGNRWISYTCPGCRGTTRMESLPPNGEVTHSRENTKP